LPLKFLFSAPCIFLIFSKFELEKLRKSFGKVFPKFLFKDNNRILEGEKETCGVRGKIFESHTGWAHIKLKIKEKK
jgi:hypothetical protein